MMKLTKRTISLLLALTMVLTICLSLFPTDAQAASFTGVTGPTLVKRDGVWYYVKNGAVCYDRTLVKYSGAWWFVKDGKVASNLTTLVKYNNEWWYVVNGKVASNTTALVKYNNEWWYVVKGKIASKTTTLVKYNNEWWYVVKGKIASNTTSLVKYNNEWWYVVKGKIAAKTTTLVKYNGSWYYIVKGKMAGNTTGFVNYNGAKYYVKNGVMQSALSGRVTVNGGTYFIKNGVLTVCHSKGHAFSSGYCNRCGTRNCNSFGHSYRAANCTSPTICIYCGRTTGTALGHSWNDATCTTPETCRRCGKTVGTSMDHDYDGDGKCNECGTFATGATEYITFKDVFLENYVKQTLGIEGNRKVSKFNMRKLTHFKIEQGIKDVQDLKYATNLESIIIVHGDVKNLHCLASINTLSKIEFYCDEVYDLSFMRKLKNLKEVYCDMRWCTLDGGAWSDLISSPRLTKLTLLDPFANNTQGWSFLSNATSLTDLELSVEEGVDISVLLKIPNLKNFTLCVGWSGRQPTEHETAICAKLIQKGVMVQIR